MSPQASSDTPGAGAVLRRRTIRLTYHRTISADPSQCSVIVAVMQIRRVRMRVPQRLVRVLVDVGFGPLVAPVAMLVMLVVDMPVGVLQAPMLMLV